MKKICINGRDELLMLDLSKVACFKADTDYTIIYYISGMTTTMSMGLHKVEEILTESIQQPASDFVRIGRSYIINQSYLYQIQLLHQKLILSDGRQTITLEVAKEALKRYKQQIAAKHTCI